MARTSKLVAAALAAALGSLGLAACGSGTPFPDQSAGGARVEVTAANLSATLGATEAQTSARVAMDVSFEGLPADQGMSLDGDGVMMLDGSKMELTASMAAAGEDVDMEMRLVDGVLYAKFSGFDDAPDGWVKLSAAELGVGGGSALGPASDPTQFLDYLNGIATTVDEVGTEKVRGVTTTHFRAAIDLAHALDREDLPPDVRRQLQSALGSLGVAIPAMPADVWVDDLGRMRKMRLLMDFGSMLGGMVGGETSGMIMSITIELYDFGTPVEVEAPPAEELVPLGGGLFGGGATA
jgi:hypothetical protein